MLFLGNVVDCIIGRQSHTELGDDFASVANRRDIMNGHSRLCLASRLHGLVNMMAPHALAAILGQQSRMKIDDAAGEGFNQIVGHQRKESRQHDETHTILLQQRQHVVRVVELCFGGNSRRNTQPLGTHQAISIGPVAQHQRGTNVFGTAEILNQIFTIRAASRHKYRYVRLLHLHKIWTSCVLFGCKVTHFLSQTELFFVFLPPNQ